MKLILLLFMTTAVVGCDSSAHNDTTEIEAMAPVEEVPDGYVDPDHMKQMSEVMPHLDTLKTQLRAALKLLGDSTVVAKLKKK